MDQINLIKHRFPEKKTVLVGEQCGKAQTARKPQMGANKSFLITCLRHGDKVAKSKHTFSTSDAFRGAWKVGHVNLHPPAKMDGNEAVFVTELESSWMLSRFSPCSTHLKQHNLITSKFEQRREPLESECRSL